MYFKICCETAKWQKKYPKYSITEDLPPFADDHICSKSLWFDQSFYFKGNTLEPSTVLPEDVPEEQIYKRMLKKPK